MVFEWAGKGTRSHTTRDVDRASKNKHWHRRKQNIIGAEVQCGLEGEMQMNFLKKRSRRICTFKEIFHMRECVPDLFLASRALWYCRRHLKACPCRRAFYGIGARRPAYWTHRPPQLDGGFPNGSLHPNIVVHKGCDLSNDCCVSFLLLTSLCLKVLNYIPKPGYCYCSPSKAINSKSSEYYLIKTLNKLKACWGESSVVRLFKGYDRYHKWLTELGSDKQRFFSSQLILFVFVGLIWFQLKKKAQ